MSHVWVVMSESASFGGTPQGVYLTEIAALECLEKQSSDFAHAILMPVGADRRQENERVIYKNELAINGSCQDY